MKRFMAALAVSIGLHLLVFVFILWCQFPAARRFTEIQMEFIAPERAQAPALINARVQVNQQRPTVALPPTPANPAPASLALTPIDSTSTSADDRLSILKLQLNNPQYLIKAYASKQNFDSLIIALQPAQYWQPDAKANRLLASLPTKSSDPIADYLHKKNIGQTPTANLLPLMTAMKSEKRAPKPNPRLESIPTRVQLHAFNVLWQANQATLPEIYASMDSSFVITAQILEEILQDMCAKNLMERKKISPSNEFTLLGPFLEHGIEMSELNRKNPVYEYSARIKREEVIRFLQARLYLLKEKMPSEPDSFSQKAITDITDKIQQILSASAESP